MSVRWRSGLVTTGDVVGKADGRSVVEEKGENVDAANCPGANGLEDD